jgi:hypothetical protein
MKELVKDWLRTKGVTLWADWDITDHKEIEPAAAWFAKEMQSFEAWALGRIAVYSPESFLKVQNLWSAPRPQDHESQLDLEAWGPTLNFDTDGLAAGGLQEYQIARDWAEGMNQ